MLLGDRLTIVSALGVLLMTAGLRRVAARRRAGTGWALLAGLLTTTYTAVDGHAARLASTAAIFVVWFFAVDGPTMVPPVTAPGPDG